MTVNVAFGGSDRMAGGDAPLPSLVSSEFRQSSDVGFMRVVEEASRASPHSQLTIGNMEPFLRKRGQSPASLTPGSGWETPRNGKESLTFDWSRNISKVRNARRPHSRMSPKEGSRGRSSSQPSASVTSRRPTARWRGDGLMTPSKADAVTRHEECSEMVVDITSRDPSPLTRTSFPLPLYPVPSPICILSPPYLLFFSIHPLFPPYPFLSPPYPPFSFPFPTFTYPYLSPSHLFFPILYLPFLLPIPCPSFPSLPHPSFPFFTHPFSSLFIDFPSLPFLSVSFPSLSKPFLPLPFLTFPSLPSSVPPSPLPIPTVPFACVTQLMRKINCE